MQFDHLLFTVVIGGRELRDKLPLPEAVRIATAEKGVVFLYGQQVWPLRKSVGSAEQNGRSSKGAVA